MDIVQVVTIGSMLAVGGSLLAILVHYAKLKKDKKEK